MQIPEIPAQRKFVSAMCHAHSNAHKPPKAVAPTVLMLDNFNLNILFSSPKKKFSTPTVPVTNRPQTSKNRNYERGYLGNYQR